jgi:hypothetical protein
MGDKPVAMTDKHEIPTIDVTRRIAHDSAADAVPVRLTQDPEFNEWRKVVEDVADTIEYELREAEP